MTHLLYLDDAFLTSAEGIVTDVRDGAVSVDRTVFYATSGGQPHDEGHLRWDGDRSSRVVDSQSESGAVWLALDGDVPAPGTVVTQEIDWARRHQLMRTHTALHILCGVIWNEWGCAVTGGNMEPLAARMDFEFDPLPPGFKEDVERLVNLEIDADRPVEVSFVPRADAVLDAALIRTKVNLVPESVTELRIVDIVGLDRQADGGTHVRRTAEVGRLHVLKTESKGRQNKRLRIAVADA